MVFYYEDKQNLVQVTSGIGIFSSMTHIYGVHLRRSISSALLLARFSRKTKDHHDPTTQRLQQLFSKSPEREQAREKKKGEKREKKKPCQIFTTLAKTEMIAAFSEHVSETESAKWWQQEEEEKPAARRSPSSSARLDGVRQVWSHRAAGGMLSSAQPQPRSKPACLSFPRRGRIHE